MHPLHNVNNNWIFFFFLLVSPLNEKQTEQCESVAAAACQSLMVRSGSGGSPGHLRLLPHNEYDEDG